MSLEALNVRHPNGQANCVVERHQQLGRLLPVLVYVAFMMSMHRFSMMLHCMHFTFSRQIALSYSLSSVGSGDCPGNLLV